MIYQTVYVIEITRENGVVITVEQRGRNGLDDLLSQPGAILRGTRLEIPPLTTILDKARMKGR